MELNEGKEWLVRTRKLDHRIYELSEEIKAKRSLLEVQGISYDTVRVISTPENRFEKVFAEIDLLQRNLDELCDKRRNVAKEIKQEIMKLPESPERAILIAYYVAGEKMTKISEDLNYELTYCYRLKDKGIEQL